MSILIKGMEMPTKENAVILITPSGDVWMIGDMPNEDTHLVKAKAVNVPPHGRLGDLDALEEKAIERSRCGVSVNVLEKVITAYDIETAPTVIPAEEGE